MKKTTRRVCRLTDCDIQFATTSNNWGQRYCSRQCANQARATGRKKNIIGIGVCALEDCDKEFPIYAHFRAQKTCCKKHGNRYRYLRIQEAKASGVKKAITQSIRPAHIIDVCHQDDECAKYADCGGKEYPGCTFIKPVQHVRLFGQNIKYAHKVLKGYFCKI